MSAGKNQKLGLGCWPLVRVCRPAPPSPYLVRSQDMSTTNVAMTHDAAVTNRLASRSNTVRWVPRWTIRLRTSCWLSVRRTQSIQTRSATCINDMTEYFRLDAAGKLERDSKPHTKGRSTSTTRRTATMALFLDSFFTKASEPGRRQGKT